ncbi:3052_t:CDS:2, partial [Paraglomus brasilianum]
SQTTKRSREKEGEHNATKYLRVMSIPGTHMFKTVVEDNSIQEYWNVWKPPPNVPHSTSNFQAFRNMPNRFFCDKTNYIRLLEAQPDYKILFLRPRQFGKSTLISTLAAYYDVHTKNSFQSLFGDLDIGKNPTSWANKHLVLILDLSTVEMGNLTKMED